jgi:hypothetical protein
MEDLIERVDILNRNSNLLDMFFFEKKIEDSDHIDLVKKNYLLSRVEKANEAIVETLKFLGLGSIEEMEALEEYRIVEME